MLRVLFDFRRSWLRACIRFVFAAAALLISTGLLLWIGLRVPRISAIAAMAIAVLLSRVRLPRWPRWLCPLTSCARRFHRTTERAVTLYVDPRYRRIKTCGLFQMCHRHLDELADWFGFNLGRRLIVVVHADPDAISHMLGVDCTGFAVCDSNVIVVYGGDRLTESIRHEIAHLFSTCWNRRPLPLLNEGLATWLQRRIGGTPLSTIECELLSRSSPDVSDLLPWHRFLFAEDRFTNYVLAASFTAFLVRQFGRERYRRFFRLGATRLCNKRRFGAAFQRCFGVPLSEANYQWRVNVLVMHVLEKKLESELRQGHFLV